MIVKAGQGGTQLVCLPGKDHPPWPVARSRVIASARMAAT